MIWGNGASGSGNPRLVVPITRGNANAGQLNVMVGVAAHGEAWALSGLEAAFVSLTVNRICVDSVA